MITLQIENREFENIFKDVFHEQKEKLIEFVLKTLEKQPPKLNIENHLEKIEYRSTEQNENIFLDLKTENVSKEIRDSWNRT